MVIDPAYLDNLLEQKKVNEGDPLPLAKELVSKDNPILTEKLENFDFSDPPINPTQFAHILAQSMLKNDGLGLAANQIGYRHRAFVIKANPIICCYNPRIVNVIETEEGDSYAEEGCLTFPGLIIKIKRHSMIRVRYEEPSGETVTKTFANMTARAFQHELDHLDGILFTTRATKYHLDQARNRKKKYDREKEKAKAS